MVNTDLCLQIRICCSFLKRGIFLEKIKHLKTHRIWCLVFVFLIYPIITIVRGCWQRSCLNTCFVVKRSDVTAKIWFKVNIDSPHCAEQSWSPTRWGFYLGPLTVTSPSTSVSECFINITVCCQAIMTIFGCPHTEAVGLKNNQCSKRHKECTGKTS